MLIKFCVKKLFFCSNCSPQNKGSIVRYRFSFFNSTFPFRDILQHVVQIVSACVAYWKPVMICGLKLNRYIQVSTQEGEENVRITFCLGKNRGRKTFLTEGSVTFPCCQLRHIPSANCCVSSGFLVLKYQKRGVSSSVLHI